MKAPLLTPKEKGRVGETLGVRGQKQEANPKMLLPGLPPGVVGVGTQGWEAPQPAPWGQAAAMQVVQPGADPTSPHTPEGAQGFTPQLRASAAWLCPQFFWREAGLGDT